MTDRIQADAAWKRAKAQCERCAKYGYPDGEGSMGYTHGFGSRPDWSCYADPNDIKILWSYLHGDR